MHGETNEFVNAQQAKLYNIYKNTKLKLLKTKAAIWFNKICRDTHLQPNYIGFKINEKGSPTYISTQNAIQTH